jgi:hypothetical protein
MKRLKKILCLILIMGIVLGFNNTKSVAAEVQYTENVIPAMTSDTSPSGVASASSMYVNANGSKQYAYLAFDHSTSQLSSWGATANETYGWLEYDFTDEKCITKYTLQPREWVVYVTQSPKDWTFEAWDEGTSTWVVLDTQTNITGWMVGYKKEFTFSNTKYYHKYRINVSSIENGSALTAKNARTLAIGELEMMETASTQSSLKVVLGVGESLQLSVNNDLDVNSKMTWTSDDDSIATVDAKGIATGVKSGSTVITVTNADGSYKETINLLVINEETDLQLAIDLRVGDTRRLTVDDLTDTVTATWASNSQSVATVSDTGKVTAIGVGTTYVTATDDLGNEIGKILVRVRK